MIPQITDADQATFTTMFVIGLVAVLIDSISKYDRRDPREEVATNTVDYIRPSMLTSGTVYKQSFIFYIFLRLLIFAGIALLLPMLFAPDFLNVEAIPEPLHAILEAVRDLVLNPYWPLVWGLATAGVIEHVPYAKNIEPAVRRLALTAAFVPHGVRLTKQKIDASRFRIGGAPLGAEAVNKFLRTIETGDFDRAENSLEERWARFAGIVYLLDPANRAGIRSQFMETYGYLFRSLEDDFNGLKVRVKFFRSVSRGATQDKMSAIDPEILDALKESDANLAGDVDRALEKAETALACALPTAMVEGRSSAARLRSIGFDVPEAEGDISGSLFVTVLVVAVAAFFGAILSELVTLAIASLAPDAITYPAPPPPGQPQVERTIIDRALTILLFTTATLAALFLFTFTVGKGFAQIDGSKPHPTHFAEKPIGDYISAGLTGAMAGFVILIGLVYLRSGGANFENTVLSLLFWAPRMVVLAVLAQVIAYGPGRTALALARSAFGLALIDMVVIFVTSIAYFQHVGATFSATLGQAIYLSIVSFAISASVLYIFATLSHRQRAARGAANVLLEPAE